MFKMNFMTCFAFFLRHRRRRQSFLLTCLAVCAILYISLCIVVVQNLNVSDSSLSVISVMLGKSSNHASRTIPYKDVTQRTEFGRKKPNGSLEEKDFVSLQKLTTDTPKKRQILPWKRFIEKISVDEMYSYQADYMADLLHQLHTSKIVNVTIFKGGTQVKFLLVFENGNTAIAKPMRNPRDFYWANNKTQPFYLDPERHTAEIASFHLDRILNYRRVAPCIGRRVSFVKEIINKTNDPGILGTLRKQDGSDCFFGECAGWFCNENHLICSQDDVMELSVCQQIPGKIYDYPHPWSQGSRQSKVWKNTNVCPPLYSVPRMRDTRFFLDIMEVALFDHLIVNYDRHHIAMLDYVDKERTFAALIDNGKGFSNPFKDDVTFLAPIYQCCRFRNSTYQHILSLTKNNNTRLGDLMKRSLSQDPLAPILTDPFFPTLDRRLAQFYDVISKCIEAHGADVVLRNKNT